MIASELISDELAPVRTSDTGEQVLNLMSLHQVRHLPIVNNEELLGVISEDDILSQDIEAAIGSYALSMRRPFAETGTNIFEMMNTMSEYNLSILPVVDEQNHFKGMVLQQDLLHYFAKSSTFNQPGSVIIIQVNRQDYSLVEISSIVETENALILGLFIYEHVNPNSIRLFLKLNTTHLDHIVPALERYSYHVEASFTEDEYDEGMQDRYDSLMNYLNV